MGAVFDRVYIDATDDLEKIQTLRTWREARSGIIQVAAKTAPPPWPADW